MSEASGLFIPAVLNGLRTGSSIGWLRFCGNLVPWLHGGAEIACPLPGHFQGLCFPRIRGHIFVLTTTTQCGQCSFRLLHQFRHVAVVDRNAVRKSFKSRNHPFLVAPETPSGAGVVGFSPDVVAFGHMGINIIFDVNHKEKIGLDRRDRTFDF